jgi:hypothetical protein
MSRSTEFREHALPQAPASPQASALSRAWAKLKAGVHRTIFWAYERGTWQYDVMVLAILAFVFLTPRAWFQDQPTLHLTALRHSQGIVEVGRGKDGLRFLVDARLVDAVNPREPEEAIRSILRNRLDRPFTIKSVDPVRDRSNVVLGYAVVVQ